MDFRLVLRARRSIKQYDPQKNLDDATVLSLLEAIALTPSSFNIQNWEVVLVRDKDIQARLKAAAWNQAQVLDASAVFVLAGDLKAAEDPSTTLRNASPELRENFTRAIQKFYGQNEQLLRDEACRSVGLAGMSLMLAAKDLGLESCPMIGFDPAQVAEILGLPAHLPPLLLVTVGFGLAPARPRLGLKSLEEFVSVNRYGERGLKGQFDES